MVNSFTSDVICVVPVLFQRIWHRRFKRLNELINLADSNDITEGDNHDWTHGPTISSGNQ